MPDPHLRIVRRIADEPYGWAASYRALLTPGQVALTLRLQLQPRQGVTGDCLAQVRRETEKAVAQHFDGRFLVEEGSERQRPVRVSVEFATSDPDLSVIVHPGSGRDNLQHWFVNSGVTARAHEVGHAFGLKDEYADPLAANRAALGAAGVFQDHSLMGDFQQEGIARAELKLRHAAEMMRGLGEHLEENFRVTLAGAGRKTVRAHNGPEATNPAAAAAGGVQALRELARHLDAPCPHQGRSGRVRP